ncbi:MAG: valine--tRNA ligase [Bacteroidota bacterium]|nr:valine--tRNA ligase [Bacteroidota bacterium]
MELESHLNSSDIESKWYQYWEQRNYFKSVPDHREAFTIVIPPPNITGILHMGHMLNNTIQDVLIRKARLDGKNACWVPGTDHASIATEAKVVQMLREKGIKKSDLSRDEFLQYAYEWKEKYGGIILTQLRKLGASCDWDRTAFTMDETRSESVIKIFVDLYRKGLLYKGKRMVHWDPEAKTVLSNEEVIYKEESAQLFHLKYFLDGDPDQYIVIATQRPETIMADTAVAVHPDDETYKSFHGKRVIIPLINRSIPIITDTYVDREFGTGALKVTPAHDQNDYELGIKHKLDVIDILNEDGSLNNESKILIGEDRFIARKKIKPLLEDSGHLLKLESYQTNIGRSERTNAVVEPRLSLQWYVDMKSLAQPALEAVLNGDIHFLPDHMKNTYRHWMENIRDWCISRQLWWGHRVPAYYYADQLFVAETAEEALQEAIEKTGKQHLQLSDLKMDEDVLDTWFSSWLWPISLFDGFKNTKDFQYYYPTSVLVTGWDIIFLWVARMIMAGYEWTGTYPFKKVYFTGMVRDKQRRKMSKSLGNSPDALKLINDFGADGVRFGMLSCSPAGGDLLFDEKLCEQGRNFSNKIWNATRLVYTWNPHEAAPLDSDQLIMNWMDQRLSEIITQTNILYDQFKLSEILKELYGFIWNDFCAFYLEAIKPNRGDQISIHVKEHCLNTFESICILLHPYMPFITEEIWHLLRNRKIGNDCMVSNYPNAISFDKDLLLAVSEMRNVISSTRELRNKHGIKMGLSVPLHILKHASSSILDIPGCKSLLMKLANLNEFRETEEDIPGAQSFIGLRNQYFLSLPISINVEEEKEKLEKEIEYTKGFITSIRKKLDNEKFMTNAPKDLLEKEQKKLDDGLMRLTALEESLQKL